MNNNFIQNGFGKFLDSKLEENKRTTTQTSYFLSTNDETSINKQKSDRNNIKEINIYEIEIQTVKKFDKLENKKGEIYLRKKVNINDNIEKKNFLKIDKGIQTINYYEEESDNNFININYNKNNKININKDNKINIDNKKIIKRLLGRKTKKSGLIGKHNKYSLDNIIRKVKTRFIDSAFNYINSKFKNKKLILLKIIGRQSKEINRNKNILWLKKKMKDIFYEDISKKTFNSNKDYNRQLIDKIYLENTEKEVIELLNMNIIEFMKLYCSKEKIEGMKQLDEIINELEMNGENEEYINKFRKVSIEFELTINNLVSRERNTINF